MLPDDPRHGSERGHEQHARDGEDPCAACYEAKLIATRRRSKRKQMGYVYTVSTHAARARIHEWRDGGATWGEIADHVGIGEGRVWDIANDKWDVIYTRTHVAIMRAEGWPVTVLGIRRRVHALTRLGYSAQRIAEACNVHHDTIIDIRRRQPEFVARKVRDGIVAGYDRLSMRLPDATTKQEKAGITRARNHGAKMGWPAPMSWDDIDNPHERPAGHRVCPEPGCAGEIAARGKCMTHYKQAIRSPALADVVLVDRILAGDWRMKCAPEIKAEVCRRWVVRGGSLNELAKHTGWRPDRYWKVGGAA